MSGTNRQVCEHGKVSWVCAQAPFLLSVLYPNPSTHGPWVSSGSHTPEACINCLYGPYFSPVLQWLRLEPLVTLSHWLVLVSQAMLASLPSHHLKGLFFFNVKNDYTNFRLHSLKDDGDTLGLLTSTTWLISTAPRKSTQISFSLHFTFIYLWCLVGGGGACVLHHVCHSKGTICGRGFFHHVGSCD